MIERETQVIRDYIVNYLIRSGFVDAYTRKLMFSSDIDNYYEDFRQEAWTAILEQKPSLWLKLYDSAIEKDTDLEYEARNYFSMVIRNTVKSDSSNAYRKLKGGLKFQKTKTVEQWHCYENQIPDSTTITDTIISMND